VIRKHADKNASNPLSAMLLAVTALKLIAEIAGMALLGQWIVGLLAGAKRDQNIFYQLLAIIGKPFVAGARRITPKFVLERHLPLVALLLLFFIWLVTVILKIQLCLELGMQVCR
jgi:hypothetical protein